MKLYQRKHGDTRTWGSQCVYSGFVTVIKQFKEGGAVLSSAVNGGGPPPNRPFRLAYSLPRIALKRISYH